MEFQMCGQYFYLAKISKVEIKLTLFTENIIDKINQKLATKFFFPLNLVEPS